MVSIIVPIYNLEKLISRCINSIISQTYADWELILIDDGSTDSSLKVCNNFANIDKRIKIIHQANAGAATARNTGINYASGEWITFVDGDDIIPHDAISLLLSATTTDTDIVAGNITTKFTNSKIHNINNSQSCYNSKEYISLILKDLTYYGPCGKLFKHELFTKAKWNFKAPLSNYEDLLMLVAISSVADKIRIRNDLNVYTYIQREGSASKSHLNANECKILFNELSKLVENNEAFFLFRLRRLYDNCIINGEKLKYKSDLIGNLLKERKKYKLTGHDKIIELMLRSKLLRKIVHKRHSIKTIRDGAFISIIISAYNEEKYISRAIKSALVQTLKEIEIIVVNDASSDNTANIVKSFSATDNRVRLISHEKNMGLNQTRLTGLNFANGEYVIFMDADDTFEPQAMEKLHDKAIKSQCDIIVMGARRVTRFFHFKLPFFSPARAFQKDIYNTQELLPLLLSKNGISLSLWDKLYRRDMLQSLNLKAEDIFMGEDMLTNIRIFNSHSRLSWIDYVGYNWTTGGKSHKSASTLWEDNKTLCLRCHEILKEIEATNSDNMKALSRGIANSFILSITQMLVNPFASKAKYTEWAKQELQSNFWDTFIPHLNNDYDSIAKRDIKTTIKIAQRNLNAHLPYILAIKLLR